MPERDFIVSAETEFDASGGFKVVWVKPCRRHMRTQHPQTPLKSPHLHSQRLHIALQLLHPASQRTNKQVKRQQKYAANT
ncbi:MAG: hypothetical protein DRP82_07140 [Planctomycetota bacterium]|nr:MAG: hypothetical protein DRP82_07140 [Planctomycetota bacterium]